MTGTSTENNVPDIPRCLQIMEKYEMLPNIREHSIIVARVALRLIDGFCENMPFPSRVPNRNTIAAGALLHDIAKTPCLQNGGDHAEAGAEICLEMGYPEIAAIVREHVILRDHDPERRRQGKFNAREIIYYADKRVRHEEIVSLDDRLEYILEHYGNGDPEMHQRIHVNFEKCVELEQYIFAFLSFAPDELAAEVSGSAMDQILSAHFKL